MIVYFDGICYLCNSLVDFLIKIDKRKKLKFSPLQSDFAQKELKNSTIDLSEVDSIIVQKGNKIYIKSDALIEVIKQFSWCWRVFLIIKIFPQKFADKIYDYIANNRLKWFGRKNECMIPTEEVKSRFILD